jgi:hypothetical protein
MEVDDDFSSKPVAKAPQEVVPAELNTMKKLMLQQMLFKIRGNFSWK